MKDFIPTLSDSHFFIHNCMGSFFRGMVNWMGDEFHTKFKYKTIGTYEKTIEFFNKKKQLGHEVDTNVLPSVSMDPILDFSQDERAGKFLWQTGELNTVFGAKLFDYIDLKEQDLVMTPVFSRYQGTLEFTFWLSSVYELIDFRFALLQKFGGFNRVLYPLNFYSFIVLPESIHDFEIETDRSIDWGNTDVTIRRLDTTNREVYTLPVKLNPMIQLMSFSDASNKPGGDQVSDYKLTASINYEINLPTYMTIINKIGGRVALNVTMGSTYSKYGFNNPVKVMESLKTIDTVDVLKSRYQFYKIPEEYKTGRKVVSYESNSLHYPRKFDLVHWNPIKSGVLKRLTVNSISSGDYRKSDILLIDQYQTQFLPLLRNCNSVICLSLSDSKELLCKCESMKKVCIISDNSDFKSIIEQYIDKEITIDSTDSIIYSETLASVLVDKNDPTYAYNFIKNFKDTQPELFKKIVKILNPPQYQLYGDLKISNCKTFDKVLEFSTDGTVDEFDLDFGPEYWSQIKVYVNDRLIKNDQYQISNYKIKFLFTLPHNSLIRYSIPDMQLRSFELNSYYEFKETEIDVTGIEIPIPFILKTSRDIMLISYCGILQEGIDYELNIQEQKVKILIPAKMDEMIEFFKGN